MDVAIDISGGANQTLADLVAGIKDRRPLNAALGKRGEIELREHFRERNQEPNKSGFPKQDFWNRIRKATALSAVDSNGATISIADPAITQKIFGGIITPKEGKYLAIAAIAVAYGKSPRSFSNLEPMFRWMNGSRRVVALVEKRVVGTASGASSRESGGTVFYWLVLSVKQKKDPRALPDRKSFEAALTDEAGLFLSYIIK